MGRQKRKSHKKTDPIRALVGFVSISSFLGTYFFTESMQVAFSVLFFAVVISILVLIVRHISYVEKLKKSGIDEIDQMSGRQFEHYLGYLFRALGYSTKVTSASGDYGADLILSKDSRTIVVQAKRYSKNVGIEAVQQVHSSMNYYNASEAWVVSNRDYTHAATSLAKSNGVLLISREQLMDMIIKVNPQAAPKSFLKNAPPVKQICESCGQLLVIREGPRGKFYGCSTFPKCRNTKAV
ncbi:restriction endonuclease [Paenibacillus sp. 481]|uniref:restriction endonuclease n=1 Tax=Paenibacillus sp. 481 TaxID=2835869 RepID=UPI001E653C02|nr:restriction endonuclease [Paenibacillus sp. 481]UHA75255.1 restriction endonuclease [Paenibacillus sp. 481]